MALIKPESADDCIQSTEMDFYEVMNEAIEIDDSNIWAVKEEPTHGLETIISNMPTTSKPVDSSLEDWNDCGGVMKNNLDEGGSGIKLENPPFVTVEEVVDEALLDEGRFEPNDNTQSERVTSRISLEQRQIMLRFMKKHSLLATRRQQSPGTGEKKKYLLETLTNKLNSCALGTTKTSEKWLKSWFDWRCDVKKKALRIKKHEKSTGGRPPLNIFLTPVEKELIAFIRDTVITGKARVLGSLNSTINADNIAGNSCTMEPVIELSDIEHVTLELPATTTSGTLLEEATSSSPRTPAERASPPKRRRLGSRDVNEKPVTCGVAQADASRIQAEGMQRLAAATERMAAAQEVQSSLSRQHVAAQERQAAAAEALSNAIIAAVQSFQAYLERK